MVATGTSRRAGQGCAVTVLLSCADGGLAVESDPAANIAGMLGIGLPSG